MNLAEQYPEACAKLIADGRPAIAEMAKHFTNHAEMSRVLGYDSSAALHWLKGRKNASSASNAHAAAWLIAHAPKPPEPPQLSEGTVLMCVCPPGKSASVQRMLAMVGCEVVEV
jgi:hypothetical protein